MKIRYVLFLLCLLMIPGTKSLALTDCCYAIVADDDDDDDDDNDKYDLGLRGPVVVCRNITKNSADVVLKARIRNKTGKTITGIVKFEVEDQNGRDIAEVNEKVIIPAGRVILSKHIITIKNPRLYSENPTYRYKAEAEVVDRNGDEISHSKERRFYISNNYSQERKHNKGIHGKNKKGMRIERLVR